MSTLEIVKKTITQIKATDAAVRILQEKYPELLAQEPDLEAFVKLLGSR